jgi:hypothetical protein
MPKYKQVEFAKLCGVAKTSLPSYRKRNQIVVEDGMIDGDNPINMAFLLKFQSRVEKEAPSAEKAPEIIESTNTNSQPEKQIKVKKNKDQDSSYHELEKIKKALDIEKTEEEIELLKKRNAKMDGESIPTEVVKNIFSVYGKNMVINFHNSSKNWLTIMAKMVNLTNAQIAEMDMELKKGANEAVLKAQLDSKKAISNIIKEYSLKREVGEHD